MATILEIIDGEQVERPATQEELAEIEARRAAANEPSVPQSIPSLNGRIAMIQAGWMPAVRAVLDSMAGIEGEIAREYFNNSLTYERNHPLVQAVPAAIGKTQDEVDALFIQAGAMKV
jgi:hypothetical protein